MEILKNMKKIVIYGILLTALLLLNATGCLKESDTCHRFIHFTNNSGKDVYYSFDYIDNMGGSYNPASAPEMFKIKNN